RRGSAAAAARCGAATTTSWARWSRSRSSRRAATSSAGGARARWGAGAPIPTGAGAPIPARPAARPSGPWKRTAAPRRRARGGGALPAAEARALFAQIVAGAAAIHAAGVVHRDLKPENVVVAGDGRAVIVDFGLAREPQPAPGATVTNAGVAVGTPRYMSPEQ